MTIYKTVGPANCYVAGTVSYNDLSESARKGIDGYYEKQGLLYDTEAELQKAYGDYLSCRENGTAYQERHVRQEITPSASNDTAVSFITTVTLPVNGQEAKELRLGAVFNRETGAVYYWLDSICGRSKDHSLILHTQSVSGIPRSRHCASSISSTQVAATTAHPAGNTQ